MRWLKHLFGRTLKVYMCSECHWSFTRRETLTWHISNAHPELLHTEDRT